jgi:ABC-type multidrug transport system ATPase subunit/ABC-type multidrug transport system permease subunit
MWSPDSDPQDLLNPNTRVVIEWKGVKLELYDRRQRIVDRIRGVRQKDPSVLLRNIDGHAGPGDIFAIMGPVGSGKTTLLKVLAGKMKGKVYGSILVNGVERDARWSKVVAYIGFEAKHLTPELTVRECLDFVAKLCLPKQYEDVEKETRIQHILAVLGLTHIADTRVGSMGSDDDGISGGERRRLSIALELLREPKILFIDEPTSGLDATSANSLINFLHQLAIIDSLTILVSIQQPRVSIMTKFANILLLSDGQPVFTGDIDEALEYFESLGYFCSADDNPADMFLDIVAGRRPNRFQTHTPIELVAKWETMGPFSRLDYSAAKFRQMRREAVLFLSEENNKDSSEPPIPPDQVHYYSAWYIEFKQILAREHIVAMRTGNYLFTSLLITLMFGLYVSFVWFQMSTTEFEGVQDRVGLLAFVPRTVIFQSMNMVIGIKSRIRYERAASMYRGSTAFASVVVFHIPTTFAIGLLQIFMIYYITGLQTTQFTAFLTFIGFNYIHYLGFLALGVIGGSLSESFETGMILSTLGVMLFRLFSGQALNLRNMTPILSWLRYLSPSFYVVQGLSQNEFIGQTIAGEPGQIWLQMYALNMISTVWAAGGGLMYGVGAMVIAYFTFDYSTKSSLNLKTVNLG